VLHGPERARSSPMMVATVLAGVQQAPKAMQPADVQARGSAAQPLWWLHIPKCGSSFETSVHMYKADQSMDSGCHKPLPEEQTRSIGHVVAMFRKPKQRMASMYYYMQTRVVHGAGGAAKLTNGNPEFYGAGWAWGWTLKSTPSSHKVRMDIYHNKSMAQTVGQYKGCQANMVLGARCMTKHQWASRGAGWGSDAEIAAHAMKRVEKFKFAGLEGEWKLSICLFNYLMTGTAYVTRGQLADNRPTTGSTPGQTTSSDEYDETDVPSDPIDEPLYEFIEKRFRTQLATYNISDSTCPDLTDFESVADFTVPHMDRLKAENLPVATGPMHNTTDDGCVSCGEDYEDIAAQDYEHMRRRAHAAQDPEDPQMALVAVMYFTFAGSIENFSPTRLLVNLRPAIGCVRPGCDIHLSVEGGSVRVQANVTVDPTWVNPESAMVDIVAFSALSAEEQSKLLLAELEAQATYSVPLPVP
jgi:hypothetical protein